MLGILKRHEIEILLKAGHSKAEAARLARISLRSVNRIAAEAPVVHVDDAAEREKRRIGRPSIVEDFQKLVVKILQEKPDLPSLEILRRVREAGYQGGKTALYAMVASVRPKETRPLIRFEGLPGEFSQHDFGEVDVAFLDGSTHRIHFFVSPVVNDRNLRKQPMIFTTNKPMNEWGKVLHDEEMAAAILDRVLERGRFIHLDGPSGRTRHLNLEEICQRVQTVPEFPELLAQIFRNPQHQLLNGLSTSPLPFRSVAKVLGNERQSICSRAIPRRFAAGRT